MPPKNKVSCYAAVILATVLPWAHQKIARVSNFKKFPTQKSALLNPTANPPLTIPTLFISCFHENSIFKILYTESRYLAKEEKIFYSLFSTCLCFSRNQWEYYAIPNTIFYDFRFLIIIKNIFWLIWTMIWWKFFFSILEFFCVQVMKINVGMEAVA